MIFIIGELHLKRFNNSCFFSQIFCYFFIVNYLKIIEGLTNVIIKQQSTLAKYEYSVKTLKVVQSLSATGISEKSTRRIQNSKKKTKVTSLV